MRSCSQLQRRGSCDRADTGMLDSRAHAMASLDDDEEEDPVLEDEEQVTLEK